MTIATPSSPPVSSARTRCSNRDCIAHVPRPFPVLRMCATGGPSVTSGIRYLDISPEYISDEYRYRRSHARPGQDPYLQHPPTSRRGRADPGRDPRRWLRALQGNGLRTDPRSHRLPHGPGVSVETAYASAGRKPQLLLAVHDMELADSATPVPAGQRDDVQRIREAQRARARRSNVRRCTRRAAPADRPPLPSPSATPEHETRTAKPST